MTRPASLGVTFRPLVPADWPEVAEIYRQGIESGNATFETEVPTWDAWNGGRSPDCRIVILGTHERLGRFHDGRWRDVVLMERRSRVAGVD